MKAFRFRLDPVLTLRNWEEERARAAYGQALRQEENIARLVRTLTSQIETDLESCRQETGAQVSPRERERIWSHLQTLEQERASCAKKLQTARRAREEKMKVLIDAHRRVRILEQLRLRRLHAHLAEARRKEEKEIDEVVNARFQPDL